MEDLYVLNTDLQIIGVIDSYSSLIWVNRYNKPGECEVYIDANDENLSLMKVGNYLQRIDDDEMTCRIKQIEVTTNSETGDYLIVKGYDVKDILRQRIIWNQSNMKGKVEDCIYKIIENNLSNPDLPERKIQNEKGKALFLLDTKQGFTETMCSQSTYKNVEEKIQNLCQTYGWGYKVKIKNENFYFSLYKGADRSDKVIFSPEFENLHSSQYINDSSNLGNVALVGGEGEGSKRSKNISGHATGIDRHEIFVDAKDISKTITWEELTNMYPTITKRRRGIY